MSENVFNPMKGVVSVSSGVPAGNYNGRFVKAEYLPATDGDPMTGKGKREYDGVRFVWAISNGGMHEGKEVSTDTSASTGIKSRFYQVTSWLMGKSPAPGEPYNLEPCVGKTYLLTLGSKPGKQWVEVTNAMMLPNQ